MPLQVHWKLPEGQVFTVWALVSGGAASVTTMARTGRMLSLTRSFFTDGFLLNVWPQAHLKTITIIIATAHKVNKI